MNFVATLNMRATAQGNYFWTAITDVITALLGFFTIFEIAAKVDRKEKIIGFAAGAVIGSILGIYLSKKILGE